MEAQKEPPKQPAKTWSPNNLFNPNIGITEAENQELNALATSFTAAKDAEAAREEAVVAEERGQLHILAAELLALWEEMELDSEQARPLPDGKYLIIYKTHDRLRMGIASVPTVHLVGPTPASEQLETFQDISIKIRESGYEVASLYYFDSEGMRRLRALGLRANTNDNYFTISRRVLFSDSDLHSPAIVHEGFATMQVMIKLPAKR